ncbi:U4/U6 small nuclear ribonucleoprotein [Niveomyces insectorum RCEF 264]|uniref:U4/U6 small nuclear ribonucleoprotein n=1 Tax=Niveomyces insectorum RCEF 264 TaxID=1081102 RepID=A0A167MGW8_9HYPO|nr:U4/U6 small nuclear ribonucleoprotein [Niveomyces insectorum RCEF 264]
MSSVSDRLAALKARVAAAVSGGSGSATTTSAHTTTTTSSFNQSDLVSNRTSGLPPSGGLNVPLHPALEDLGTRSFTTKSASKGFGWGNQRDNRRRGGASTTVNPYLDSSPTIPTEATSSRAGGDVAPTAVPAGRVRQPRQLVFNPKGKYIQQGNALRRQAALEAMKKRIAEQARKAGMDEIPSDKNFVVEEPPDVEWVDQGYFAEGKTYEDLGTPDCLVIDNAAGAHVEGEDGQESIITDLVQHPIPIEPPQDKLTPALKPMYLTRKEQKKMRRARRMAELKEKQAKIRLGLMPAPPPKVKRSNLMRVLGEEAVQDPTAVEARVNREIAERYEKHMEANEERKLTKEQRHAKLAAHQEQDAAKGIHMLIVTVPSLANAQHRFKIWKNAEQLALTGVCVMHPKANLIVVEGGAYSIKKYRKLVMNRIDWTQNTPTSFAPAPDATPYVGSAIGRGPAVATDTTGDTGKGPAREWLASESEVLPHNQIKLLFDGEAKGRTFRKWISKICDTDRDAFDFLARSKLESFWTQARAC